MGRPWKDVATMLGVDTVDRALNARSNRATPRGGSSVAWVPVESLGSDSISPISPESMCSKTNAALVRWIQSNSKRPACLKLQSETRSTRFYG